MGGVIDEIEAKIDSTWNQLQIFRFPKYLALFMVLASFEYAMEVEYMALRPVIFDGQWSSSTGISHLRQGLQCIVPRLLQCPNTYFNPKKMSALRTMRTSYQEAVDAIKFSQHYDWISYHFTGYRQHWFDCSVEGRYVQFSNAENVDRAQSLMRHQLRTLKDRKRISELISERHQSEGEEARARIIKSATKHHSHEELFKNIPINLYTNIEYYQAAIASAPSIEDAKIAGYSVKEYHDYWICLSTLLSSYIECNKARFSNDSDRFMNSSVLCMTPAEIVSTISEYCNLSTATISAITRDLILDEQERRPDIQLSPFVPIGRDEHFYVSPRVFSTANWEVCLLRRWSKKYPQQYRDLVVPTKMGVSHELALACNNCNAMAENKSIYDNTGQAICEIDLAAFDAVSQYLLISEIKWVIEPDSFQEESHVHKDLQKGIGQLTRIRRVYESDPSAFLSQLFPEKSVVGSDIRGVRYALIAKGSVDSGMDTTSQNIETLDYDFTLEKLKAYDDRPLAQRFEDVIKAHREAKDSIERNFGYDETDLAGFRFATPGMNVSGRRNMLRRHPTARSSRGSCYCGSGRKYEDCCQAIEEQHKMI